MLLYLCENFGSQLDKSILILIMRLTHARLELGFAK